MAKRRWTLPTRCKICGGFHTPKCRKTPRGLEAAIWYAILREPPRKDRA